MMIDQTACLLLYLNPQKQGLLLKLKFSNSPPILQSLPLCLCKILPVCNSVFVVFSVCVPSVRFHLFDSHRLERLNSTEWQTTGFLLCDGFP